MKRLNKKGFTLAELLVVVAIIAVLVAISIPVFTSQLEKSREATDEANIRAVYAEVMSNALTEAVDGENGVTKSSTGDYSKSVNLVQKTDGWQGTVSEIGGIDVSSMSPKAGKTATVTYTASTGAVAITFAA